MDVFFDCEFTSLDQYSELLSIGLVSSSGATFYAECDDYDPELVSDFARDVVLSLIAAQPVAPDVRGSRADVASELISWVKGIPDAGLICDSPWDIHHLRRLLNGAQPYCSAEVVDLSNRRIAERARDDYFSAARHFRHHALHDACALRESYVIVRQTDNVVNRL